MRNFKLVVAYEGTAYLGWQKTKMGPTIEESLEKALSQILQHSVTLQAASRTDAGVHAEGQVVNFFSETELLLARLKKSVNGLLPADIKVLHLEEAPMAFHPTLDARGKEYHYHVCLGAVQLPFDRQFSWHFFKDVDLNLMKKGATYFVGKHDFSALTHEKQVNNIREIFQFEVEECKTNHLKMIVSGNKFLYKMVRNMVGTLLYVGCGELGIEEIPLLLENQGKGKRGVTAPAHGLRLKAVSYD